MSNSTKWAFDTAHSEVTFKVKHLVISTVTGHFSQFSGEVSTVGDTFENAGIVFNIDVASISTKNEQRDGHLKSADFFDVEKFPKITFTGSGLKKQSDSQYTLAGNLTLKDVTKPVNFDVVYYGIAKNPFSGGEHAGFEVSTKISRKDFGLTWSVLTEAGGAVVGDDITISANIELVKEA